MEKNNPTFSITILFSISILCVIGSATSYYPNHGWNKPNLSQEWLNHGGDIKNRRYAEGERLISTSTASQLRLKWRFHAGFDISATPAISDGVVYFPSLDGFIYAVRTVDGSLIWKQNLTQMTGLTATGSLDNNTYVISRPTPTIADDFLMMGITGPAYILALKRTNGQLLWMKQLDNHPYARISMSGTYYQRALYVGVSSLEESASSENCCTFRGSFVKLDIQTGSILWRTYMIPDNNGMQGGYAGGALWGSSPSIDKSRNHIYMATGNLYSVPQDVEECQQRQNNQTIPTEPDTCIPPDVHYDSILALDLDTGKILWSQQLGGYDVWVFECMTSPENCPTGPNPDADFGEAPMMLTVHVNGTQALDIVVAVQKSGIAWALNRSNGNLLWSTQAGPGGLFGGGIWGAATDNKRVYTNIANSDLRNFTLLPSSNVTNGGGWVAMDPEMGQILWSTAVPNNATTNPVTIANDVLFAGSTYKSGPFYAINAVTGEILWSYETGASIYGGASVSNGCAYVGHGFRSRANLTAGRYLFAFCIN